MIYKTKQQALDALNALCIQFIAGDIREYGLDNENDGNLFTGTDGEIYFYCGS